MMYDKYLPEYRNYLNFITTNTYKVSLIYWLVFIADFWQKFLTTLVDILKCK